MLFIEDAEEELVPISFLAVVFQTHRPINQISNASFAYFSVSCSDYFKGRQTFKGFLSPLPMSSLLTWLEFTAAPKLFFFFSLRRKDRNKCFWEGWDLTVCYYDDPQVPECTGQVWCRLVVVLAAPCGKLGPRKATLSCGELVIKAPLLEPFCLLKAKETKSREWLHGTNSH